MRNPLDYHILQHLYKYRGIYIQQQTYWLAFCANPVWSFPFDFVSHSGLWNSIVSSNKAFKKLFETGFKWRVCELIYERGSNKVFSWLFEFVQCTSLSHTSIFWTLTIAPNKRFMKLFTTAPYLMIERMCSADYLTWNSWWKYGVQPLIWVLFPIYLHVYTMLHTPIPIRSYIQSGYNLNLISVRNPLDYHILQHLYKYRGIYIQRQTYWLAFCLILV